MSKVRDEVTKVRKSIEELASSFDTLPDQGKLERQKVLIGESIMNLLLRLDTIQIVFLLHGLHPNLRDIQKSLARELVALQEKLDSLTMKCLEESVDNSDTARNDECTVSKKEHHEEAKRQFDESLSVSENIGGQIKSDELQLLKAGNSVSEPSENACWGIIDGETQVGVKDLKSEASASLDVESQQAPLQHCPVQDFRHLNKIDDGKPSVFSIIKPIETNPEHPTGGKYERLEVATVEKSIYDSIVEDDIRLASDSGDGSSTKMEFMIKDQGTSALQPLPQADEEKVAMASDTSKIHIADEDVADSVLCKHDKFGNVDSVLNGHDKCDEGSNAVTSPENFGKLTIETQQLEVPKALTSDSEVVDNVHLEQLVAPGPYDLSPAGSSEDSSQDASNGAESGQRHEEGISDETLLPPRPEEAQLGMLGPAVETCRDENEDKATISADLSCNCSDMSNVEALAWEKEELIAAYVKDITLTTHVGEQVDEQGDNREEEVVVALEKSISDEGAEEVQQSLLSLDDLNMSKPVEEMDGNQKLIKENEKLREMMEKLMEAGKEQLNLICELTGRGKDLERRLARNKRVKSRCRTVAAKPRFVHAKSCADSMN
ncbi:hypothetical protein NL676_011686 [Syzygium grande]|nr:hypothetical protein NL676_011686 [Syzygium grande]